jgi:hypothetical protein
MLGVHYLPLFLLLATRRSSLVELMILLRLLFHDFLALSFEPLLPCFKIPFRKETHKLIIIRIAKIGSKRIISLSGQCHRRKISDSTPKCSNPDVFLPSGGSEHSGTLACGNSSW